jgi:multicomponent Na+:H+ antiporter subunit F
MTAWLAAAIALLPPLALAAVFCARGTLGRRLAAVQFAGSLGVIELTAATFVFSQPSSIELPLTLALLTLPATLLFAVFMERWL